MTNAKRVAFGFGVLRPLLLGLVLGGVAVAAFYTRRSQEREPTPPVKEERPWPPPQFFEQCNWQSIRIEAGRWSTSPVGTYQDLEARFQSPATNGHELVIPILPTVYTPNLEDELYYQAIVDSDMKPGDKVLVIGTGSGADAWTAWLKTKAPVYVAEVNPMAVANARITARLAGFSLRAVVGDIRQVDWPEDFREFDFVLWNMPYLWKPELLQQGVYLETNQFHDGDDGTVLKFLLNLLPSICKDGATAIILNSDLAAEMITAPDLITKKDPKNMLFVWKVRR